MNQFIYLFEQEIEADVENLLLKKMPDLSEEEFLLYEKNGNRLIYENNYFERRRFLKVFGLVLLWNKQPKYVAKLEEIIREICLETTWALPAHVDRNMKDWEITVDLFACETGHALSLIIKEFSELLSFEIQEMVKEHLRKRLLESFLSKKEGQWRWESFDNNWISVCAGSIGYIALDIYPEEKEELVEIVARAKRAMPNYLKSFCQDGTCLEGIDYYNYGLGFYYAFARQLYEATDGKDNLIGSEHLENIAKFQQLCYMNESLTVSFSDSGNRSKFRMGLLCYLASLFEGVEFPPMESAIRLEVDHCYRYTLAYQDYMWTKEYLEKYFSEEDLTEKNVKEKVENQISFLSEAQWAIWKYKEYGIAIKGGYNEEPHNHNDIGSFLYTVNGEIFLADIGAGEYTKAYFAEETRYSFLTTSSRGHNVPLINGEEQKAGRQQGANVFRKIGENKIHIEFQGAYDIENLQSLERSAYFDEDKEIFYIDDLAIWLKRDNEFSPSYLWQYSEAIRLEASLDYKTDIQKLQEIFISYMEPEVIGNVILLKGEKGNCTIVLNGIKNICYRKCSFHNHRGKTEWIWLIECNVITKEQQSSCNIQIKYDKLPN